MWIILALQLNCRLSIYRLVIMTFSYKLESYENLSKLKITYINLLRAQQSAPKIRIGGADLQLSAKAGTNLSTP
jgi:hypothetical protein